MRSISVEVPDQAAVAAGSQGIDLGRALELGVAGEIGSRLPLTKMTPRALELLRSAGSIAMHRGQSFVGTEHILLAILSDPASLACQVLPNAAAVRQDLEDLMGSPRYQQSSSRIIQ
jgi:hypothetical protein